MRRFFVNDTLHEATDDQANLLDVLRRELALRAIAKGCTRGDCGACRVLIDGEIVHSCQRTTGSVPELAKVVTYEHVAAEPQVIRALSIFNHERSTRCKLCVAALGVTASALGQRRANGGDATIDEVVGTAACMGTGRGSRRRAPAVV